MNWDKYRGRAVGLIALLAFVAVGGLLSIAKAEEPKWSGFYAGLHAGWGKADEDFPGAPAHPVGPPRQSLEDIVLGGQAGYNWQINNVVLGVEADISWGDLGGSVKDGNYLRERQSVDWMGSLRGRVGYAFGPVLPYLTGGLMWDRAGAGVSCPSGAEYGMCKTTGAFDFSDKQVHFGYVWGGGIEYAMLTKMSLRIEALHAYMGDETYSLGGSPWKLDHELTIVRGGVNFKLN